MPHFYEIAALTIDDQNVRDFDRALALKQHNMSKTLTTLQPVAATAVREPDAMGNSQADQTSSPTESAQSDERALSTTNESDTADLKSRPPSPPSSGDTTPVLSIAPCPLRLQSIYPPVNYGVVEDGAIFRSAFPQDRNVDFMKSLKIKNVLCLVGTEPCTSYSDWLKENGVRRHRIDIAPNKDGKIQTSWDSLCQAVLLAMDPANYPLHIHCNQGKHRTGCVIACLRKVQRVPIEEVLQEYVAYASPKARPGDMALIRSFDPEAVYEHAKTHGYLTERHFVRRMDSTISNIDSLAAALSTFSGSDSDGMDLTLTCSNSTFDEGLEMQSNASSTSKIVAGLSGGASCCA